MARNSKKSDVAAKSAELNANNALAAEIPMQPVLGPSIDPVRQAFFAAAKPLTVNVNGQTVLAGPKHLSTGSFGWYGNGKLILDAATCRKADWQQAALSVSLNDELAGVASSKQFSTGSVGWYLGQKIVIDGVRCQLGLSLIVVKSKELPSNAVVGSKVTVQVGLTVTVIDSKQLPR